MSDVPTYTVTVLRQTRCVVEVEAGTTSEAEERALEAVTRRRHVEIPLGLVVTDVQVMR